MTLEELVELPWTWRGPQEVADEAGTCYTLLIDELPDFMVAADTAQEVQVEAASALREFLRSYLENGEVPPLPETQEPKWRFHVPGRPMRAEAEGWRLTEDRRPPIPDYLTA